MYKHKNEFEMEGLKVELDTSSPYIERLVVEGRQLTVRQGFSDWFPIFLARAPIEGKQSFAVEVTAAGNN